MLYRFQYNYTGPLDKLLHTHLELHQHKMSSQLQLIVSAIILMQSFLLECMACGVNGKNDMLDVLVSKSVTFYTDPRYDTNKQGKLTDK